MPASAACWKKSPSRSGLPAASKLSEHESDNRICECAAAAKAVYIITENTRHFKKPYKTTKIVTPRQLLSNLQAGSQAADPKQQVLKSLQEIRKLQKRKSYRIVKAISESTEQFITGRYEGPTDPGDD